eukprot:Clim_evm17s155 gene=Clim_evmTU17s155
MQKQLPKGRTEGGGGCPFHRSGSTSPNSSEGTSSVSNSRRTSPRRTMDTRTLEETYQGGCPILGPANPIHLYEENKGVRYGGYLQLDKILGAQKPLAAEAGNPAHEEMLFIIVHQSHELWMKQVIFEINSIIDIMDTDYVPERQMLSIVSRLDRIKLIWKNMSGQLGILETMTPQSFMEFRDYLVPASGFQSVQFRVLENLCGLKQGRRSTYQRKHYYEHFETEEAEKLRDYEEGVTLVDVVNDWLERTPAVFKIGDSFFQRYKMVVEAKLEARREAIEEATSLYGEEDEETEHMKEEYKREKALAEQVLDRNTYETSVSKGQRSLSFEAMKGALLIYHYRDEPQFHLSWQFITSLVDIDKEMLNWRYRHMEMVQRMIGSKSGTGGSSGYLYLRSTISDRYKVFNDLSNLTTHLLAPHEIPKVVSPETTPRSLSLKDSD